MWCKVAHTIEGWISLVKDKGEFDTIILMFEMLQFIDVELLNDK